MNAKPTFTEGVRDDTSLIIGIAGASGSGKTVTALLTAVGLAGGEPIAFIDTEGGRARHYFPTPSDTRTQDELLPEFLFRVLYKDMKPPLTPRALWTSIEEAIGLGARVVVIDSASDEWEGIGGLHDMHRDEMARLAKKPYDALQDWELHKFNFPAWSVPKAEHKSHLMKNLRQVRAHVIFCFRAKEVIKPVEIEGSDGRKRSVPTNVGWQPICEQNMLYDLTISFMVTPDQPGVPLIRDGKFYGKLNPPYARFFAANSQITVDTGRQLRAWARGDQQNAQPPSSGATRQDAGPDPQAGPASTDHVELLAGYDRALAGEAFRSELEERHAGYRPRFAGQPDAVRQAARRILNLHTDRVENQITLDDANRQVREIIEGIAA